MNERLTPLKQREIEAQIIGPVYRAMVDEIGAGRASEILRRAIFDVAYQCGRELRAGDPQGSLGTIAALWRRLAEGGALEIEFIDESARRLHLRVTRCRYAEMYRAEGLDALGEVLSCSRDGALLAGFSDRLAMQRTANILSGDRVCEFTYTEVP